MVRHQPTSDLVRSCKMENVTFIEIETMAGTETHAIIDRGNGEYTSMPKAEYDRRQAEQSTPNLPGNADKL